jgi:hypothetical protein
MQPIGWMHGELMSNPETQRKKLGEHVTRGPRNAWAESIETKVRALSPFPITYDVSAVQPTNFSEYAYTELAGGMWITTQSLEINARLLHYAAQQDSVSDTLDRFAAILQDKYVLDKPETTYKKVCFLPGSNALDVVSIETVARLVHEEEDVMFKLHPLTNDDAINSIRKRVGWNRMLSRELSGMELLRRCDVVYTSSASEMAITGTALGKKVVNISNFMHEGSGAYHAISRLLFIAHRDSVATAQRVLVNVIDCPWSGTLFPWHMTDARIAEYFDKTLKLRDMYRPLAAPRGNPPQPKPEQPK